VPDVPFVLVTGSKDGMVLEALKRGASDSVSKDELPLLVPRLKRAIEESEKEQERAHLKHELMEIEERLRLLQDGVKDFAMYVLDPAGRIAWWNAGALVMHGMESGELVGQPFWRLLKPLKGARARVTDWLEAAEAQDHLEEEDWSMRRDGSQFWAHFIFTACRNPNGLLRGFTVVMRDLTETRRAAEVSRQTHSRHEAMLELAKDAFLTINEKGILLDWNGAAEKIFGYTGISRGRRIRRADNSAFDARRIASSSIALPCEWRAGTIAWALVHYATGRRRRVSGRVCVGAIAGEKTAAIHGLRAGHHLVEAD
jgi:PAS domain S-box-containing protein